MRGAKIAVLYKLILADAAFQTVFLKRKHDSTVVHSVTAFRFVVPRRFAARQDAKKDIPRLRRGISFSAESYLYLVL